MKSKLAIFDMDGTLFDTREANFRAYEEALSNYDYKLDFEYYNNYCFGKHYQEFLSNIKDFSLSEIKRIHEEKTKCYKNYLSYVRENKHLFNMIEMIRKEYYIALVTTASKKNTEEILVSHNKRNLFDLVLTHDDMEKFKPDPEGFNKAISYFSVRKEDTIIFEDSDTGIEAARRSGANVFIVDKF